MKFYPYEKGGGGGSQKTSFGVTLVLTRELQVLAIVLV